MLLFLQEDAEFADIHTELRHLLNIDPSDEQTPSTGQYEH